MFNLLAKKNGFVYEVSFKENQNSEKEFYQVWDLNLVCGTDYISEDSDIQGYVKADRFVDEVQWDQVTVYWNESLKEMLEEDGYQIINELPEIH